MKKQNFPERLKMVRNNHGINQKDFSDVMNITQSSLSKYENNLRKPDLEFFSKLSEKFKVDLNWLITGKGRMSNDSIVINGDFGKDNAQIRELAYLIENSDLFRYQILTSFLKIKKENKNLL